MDEINRWADIDENLLKEISKRFHAYDDYIQLRLVCKEWSLKLPKIPNGNKIPWLLLPDETVRNHSYEDEEIYHLMQLAAADDETLDTCALEERDIYHVMLPEMQSYNKFIRGSGHGWFIVQSISDGTMQMLNPFTNRRSYLPPVSAFPDIIDYQPDNHGDEYTLWDFRDIRSTMERDLVHRRHVYKVIINSSPEHDIENFMAVVIFGPNRRLAFYKPGNMRWVEFPTRDKWFDDVIFFQEKIYAINNYGQLYEFDTKTRAGLKGGIHETRPPSKIFLSPLRHKYLIGCPNGSLLMLVRHIEKKGEEFETSKFDIYELKRNRKKWSTIDNLGNYILVIGFNSSVQIPVPYLSKGNQIWFTDNLSLYYGPVAQDIGIFDLDHGSFHRVLLAVKFLCPPVWLLP
ncbi:putative F-box protein At5g60060 [Arachis stenosperma]|uniref:putative F-box protein At5g60060 n=1 Tax=Arachis stenosperma TaxID=217475 RepID=UPI0025ABA223|nr:putative F-box protein At5g60060 [Arachis stenosperma]